MATIIAIVNQKGGVGKTTLAVNLVRSFQLEGFSVVIADSDPQGTARDWRQSSEDKNLVAVVGRINRW